MTQTGEEKDLLAELQAVDEEKALDFEPSMEDSDAFLMKIQLKLKTGTQNGKNELAKCEIVDYQENVQQHAKNSIAFIRDSINDGVADRNTYALYLCSLNKDYATLSDLAKRQHVDINHIFASDTFIEKQYQGLGLVHILCANGDVEGLEEIIALGADPTIKTNNGDTGLHIGCRFGHSAVANFLLKVDSLLKDAKNKKGMTPLLEALNSCPRFDKEDTFLECVQILIEAGCDVNHVSDTSLSPLHVAARKWHKSTVLKLLIKAGADVNAEVQRTTPLVEAVSCVVKHTVDQSAVESLIQAGASVNFRDLYGRSPLCYFARHSRVSKKLNACFLKAGFSRDLSCYHGLDCFLLTALLNKDFEMVKLLQRYETDPNRETESLLLMAVRNGYENMVRYFLENGGNANSRTPSGELVLSVAVESNKVTIADLLLSHGADINQTLFASDTPLLCHAAELHFEEMTLFLLDNGADINAKTPCGLSAIHFAVFGGIFRPNISMTKKLLERNCDLPPDILQRAIDHGGEAMIKLLCDAGCPLPEPPSNFIEHMESLGYEKEFTRGLYNLCCNPRPLLHLCIGKIRKQCGPRLRSIMDTLALKRHIPLRVIDMILLKNLPPYSEMP